MTTKTATSRARKRASTAEPATVMDRARRLIADDPEFQQAADEVLRLKIEQARIEGEIDQERAKSSDVDDMVSQIEAGQELSPEDSADKLRILRDQHRAYSQAIARAEQRRSAVLQRLSRESCDGFEAEHRQALQDVFDTLESLQQAADKLSRIPQALKAAGLSPNETRFPRFHERELMELRPRLKWISEAYLAHLGDDR